jgi:ATP-dependent DNA ligase
MRVNRGQEFVIGGYTVGPKNFDALIFGYYEGDKLMYVARTRETDSRRHYGRFVARFSWSNLQ